MYTTLCEIDSWGEAAVERRELSLVLCHDLDGWVWGGEGCEKEVQEGRHIYVYL